MLPGQGQQARGSNGVGLCVRTSHLYPSHSFRTLRKSAGALGSCAPLNSVPQCIPCPRPVPLKLQHLAVRPSGVDLWIGPQVPYAAVDAQRRGQRHHANQRVAASAAEGCRIPGIGTGRAGRTAARRCQHLGNMYALLTAAASCKGLARLCVCERRAASGGATRQRKKQREPLRWLMQWLACDAGCHSHFAAHPAERPAGHGQNAGSTVDSPRDGGRDLRSLEVLKQAEPCGKQLRATKSMHARTSVRRRAFQGCHSLACSERRMTDDEMGYRAPAQCAAERWHPEALVPAACPFSPSHKLHLAIITTV
jgi:hypothetical protein